MIFLLRNNDSIGLGTSQCLSSVLFNTFITHVYQILTLCETCFASSGLTQDRGTAHAQHDCLCMAEHRRDLVASCRERTAISSIVLVWEF